MTLEKLIDVEDVKEKTGNVEEKEEAKKVSGIHNELSTRIRENTRVA